MEVNEAAIAYSKQKISIKEYLEMENDAPEKHEYYQGEVFAMSGAKIPHIVITGNIFAALKQKLKSKPCQPFVNDMRIHIEATGSEHSKNLEQYGNDCHCKSFL